MLTHVTFTGWDDRTDLGDLADFCREQRKGTIEIAVLLSASRAGEDRYPGFDGAEGILRTARLYGQHAAVHVCGRLAREIMAPGQILPPMLARPPEIERDMSAVPSVVPERCRIFEYAERIQVNVSEDFWPTDGYRYGPAVDLGARAGRTVIVQARETTWPTPPAYVQFLFDRSGGRSQVSEEFPRLTAFPVGYAGGITPANVLAIVDRIESTAPSVSALTNASYWIDMESGVRLPVDKRPRRPDEPPTPTYLSVAQCRRVMDVLGLRVVSTGWTG